MGNQVVTPVTEQEIGTIPLTFNRLNPIRHSESKKYFDLKAKDVIPHRASWRMSSAEQLYFSDIDIVSADNNHNEHLAPSFIRLMRDTVQQNLQFVVSKPGLQHVVLSANETVAEDSGNSGGWNIIPINARYKWGEIYFLELVIECMNKDKMVMVGLIPYYRPGQCMIGRGGFCAKHHSDLHLLNKKIQIIFDLTDMGGIGNIYTIIDGCVCGKETGYRALNFTHHVPIVCLGYGCNKVRISKLSCPPDLKLIDNYKKEIFNQFE
ncbi:Swoo [Acrasis kona]|uniref:Swoo n=1 Tax=Acrasis kona TaxID=1008807 RepID=A0AAW2Z8Z6_9EUKA